MNVLLSNRKVVEQTRITRVVLSMLVRSGRKIQLIDTEVAKIIKLSDTFIRKELLAHMTTNDKTAKNVILTPQFRGEIYFDMQQNLYTKTLRRRERALHTHNHRSECEQKRDLNPAGRFRCATKLTHRNLRRKGKSFTYNNGLKYLAKT